MKSFRAEVSAHGGSWTLLVPSLDNLMRGGNSLIEAEDEMRGAMADLLGIAKERARRTVPSDLGHSAMRT
jgi:hypothetical protein